MVWKAPEVTRNDPPRVAGERAALEGWLDYHRQTLLTKCAGLTAEQLRTPAVPPSRLTLQGLVRHMAEVERGWFRQSVAGEDLPEIYCTEDSREADFFDLEGSDAEADLATFLAEIDAARAAAAGKSLDDTFERPHGAIDVRWTYIHMIEEYARHNGHADLMRERIDGATGD